MGIKGPTMGEKGEKRPNNGLSNIGSGHGQWNSRKRFVVTNVELILHAGCYDYIKLGRSLWCRVTMFFGPSTFYLRFVDFCTFMSFTSIKIIGCIP